MDRDSAPERIRTRQLARLGALFAGFAHEIRNPLSTIRLNLSLVKEDLAEPENPQDKRVHKRLGVVEEQVVRLQDVLDQFLAFVRIPELQRQPTDLHAMLDRMVEFETPAADELGVSLRLYEDRGVGTIDVDPNLLRAVLENLVRNALQACAADDEILVVTRREADAVVVQVIDTGPGIPAEVRDKIFMPFFSTKKGGHGLGLPTARRIVEQHGGSLEVRSEEGKGTQFEIRLPLHEPSGADLGPAEVEQE